MNAVHSDPAVAFARLLMLAAIALAYAETGRLLPDAYGIDAEWVEGQAA